MHALMDDLYKNMPESAHTLWNQFKENNQLREYMYEVAKLTWKMVIQRPPMTFDFDNTWKGERFHDIYYKSVNPKEATACTVYPILWHNKSLMKKGKLFFIQKGKANGDPRSNEREEVCAEVKVDIEKSDENYSN